MLRAVVPRLAAQARHASGKIKTHHTSHIQPSRSFGSRWLPIRRKYWLDDCMHYNMAPWTGPRMMDRHLRKIDRLMEEMKDPSSRWGSMMERSMPQWRKLYEFTDSQVAVLKEDGHFKVNVDVSEHNPEDVSVRTSGDRLVVRVQNTRDPYKIQSKRELTVLIPEEVQAETFESLLAEDGILTIQAKMKAIPKPEERVIEIQHVPKKKDN